MGKTYRKPKNLNEVDQLTLILALIAELSEQPHVSKTLQDALSLEVDRIIDALRPTIIRILDGTSDAELDDTALNERKGG